MADKTIGMLENVPSLHDESLLPVEQSGELMNLSGKQIREFVSPYADSAHHSAMVATVCESSAREAWTGVQNAIKNIPAGSTPIIDDLTTGGASMALSAEMGKVLGQRPNPNLLANWYFPDPINQRGKTSYGGAANTYTVDRWRVTNANTTVAVDSDGITITGAPGATPYLQQLLESPSQYLGCQVTLSVLTKDGTLYKATSTLPKAFPSAATLYCGVNDVCDVLMTSTTLSVRLKAAAGGSIGVVAVKLETGSASTLAHVTDNGALVLNKIPDKGMEIMRCIQSTADSSDDYANKVVLHTGNKPTGSYTGNGSAATREIATGGLNSHALLIRNGTNGRSVIVMYAGAIALHSDGTVVGYPYGTAQYNNNILALATTDADFNANGITYTYQVL